MRQNKKNTINQIFLLSIIVLLCFFNNACSKSSTPTPTPVLPPVPIPSTFIRGADISWLTQMESSGLLFYDSTGAKKECMNLLQSLGTNAIRIRAWVNPTSTWNSTADVIAKAVRAKNLGLKVMIDFHYSDTWADPGHQSKPAAWVGQSFTTLTASLASYTTDVLTQLQTAGVTPDWVQVGNETNDGMLWPDGQASVNMANFAQLVNAGYNAVKAVFPNTKVIVHISNGYDNVLFRWMFDGLTAKNAKYDIIGMSLYPTAANWSSYNAQCLSNMNDMVARYGKQVMIVEVGMSWNNSTDCYSFLKDLITKTVSVTGSNGLGVMYWEPESYNNWQGYSLGAFDNNGKPTTALNAFK